MSIADRILRVKSSLPGQVELVAVSKTYPAQRIMEAYEAGQRIFGENRPQEMAQKYEEPSQGHRMAPDRPFADQ